MEPKVYVDVIARYRKTGKIIPLIVYWEDDRAYRIDEIIDATRAASLKAGGTGIRYTVRIGGTVTFLFLEEDKWFVERRA